MVTVAVITPSTFTMKKRFTSVLLLLLPVLYLNAQAWHIGLLGGVNFPNTYIKIESNLNNLTPENKKETFLSGIGLMYSHNRNLSFRSEFFYEERGWLAKNAFTINPNTGDTEISKIDYFYPFITMPVLVEGKIGKAIQIFANTGINTSLRIGGRTITDNGSIPTVFIFPGDKKPTFDFAWIGGAGLRAPIRKRFSLQTEYRYYRSWTPIGVGYSLDSIAKHKGFLLSLSIYYRL